MKKRVLMPLMVAGMMVASLVALNSCKKTEPQQATISVQEGDAIIISDRAGEYVCPYCHSALSHNEEHWHYFGTPKPDFDINEMMVGDCPGGIPHFCDVDDCLAGLSQNACVYSGTLHNDPSAIQEVINAYQSEFGITLNEEEANDLLAPRFHAHRIIYRAIINGGMSNTWHVGGGVPGWPEPHPENP